MLVLRRVLTDLNNQENKQPNVCIFIVKGFRNSICEKLSEGDFGFARPCTKILSLEGFLAMVDCRVRLKSYGSGLRTGFSHCTPQQWVQ